MKIKFFCVFIFLVFFSLSAQNIILQGKVTDSIGSPLPYANVIADPKGNASIAFAISDDSGHYKITLIKQQTYQITVSYLGYIPQTVEFTAGESQEKNFVLKPSSEALNNVTLSYTPPIAVKEDTTTYRVDAFTTGEERKLRDILKKLPDVEVDRLGNVKVHGKKVTKVLVENKTFFTGDSKLAVNNIPADAVNKIEILDNYNEIDFLKGLEDTDDMAMNIRLKKDKKRFMFGDIETGGGIKERYLMHPSLYYYSPKTTVNLIGDFNNTGSKSFTIKDYLDFEGGYKKIILQPKIYFSLIKDDFAKFLTKKDFIASRNKFGALSINQTIGQKTEFSSYIIWSDMQNKTEQHSINDYLTSDHLKENRKESSKQNSQFGIGKLRFKIEPNDDTYITFKSYIKASDNNSLNQITTTANSNNKLINTKLDADNISFKQEIEWHKQSTSKHTTSTVLVYHYQKAIPNTNWLTNQTILQGLIPVINQNTYNIFKEKFVKSHNINFVAKHYWVLNRFNHIYFTLGNQLAFDNYKTIEFQRIEDGSVNDFNRAGFGNDADLNFNDVYIGIQYKVKKGIVILKPGLFYHQTYRNLTQLDILSKSKKALWLPEFTAKVKFNKSHSLRFNYKLTSNFPVISQLANRLTLTSFNQIYQGNENLEHELYHKAQLIFIGFKFFKGFFYSVMANYKAKERNIVNKTNIQGIDFVSSPVLTDFADKMWNFNGSVSKVIDNYKFSASATFSFSDYETPVNTELLSNTSNNFIFSGGVQTRFKKFPYIELNYSKSITSYRTTLNSEFQSDMFSFLIEYDFLKSFVFKADYRYENYFNKTSREKSIFDLANVSLFYQKESSPWGFEISANNIFDVKFKERNALSTILVSDVKTYILPRIMMFKISYKL